MKASLSKWARAVRAPAWATALGALFGLVLFAVEARMIMSQQAIGLKFETSGPLAQLMAAVKPALTAILLRVASAYAFAGACVGAAAFALATVLAGKRARWAVWFVELLTLSAMWAWLRAVERPALFDDLHPARGVLAWLVDHGQPWHAQLALALWWGSHALIGTWKARMALLQFVRRRAVWGVAAVLSLVTLAVFHGLRTAAQAPPAPWVFLVGIDALRPDRLRAYGANRVVAPHLDELLEEAIVFDNAYTPIAQTEPAWRSLLTARWPTETGVRHPLTADSAVAPLRTFPMVLNERGVETSFATDCSRFNFQGAASGFANTWQPPRGALNFALEKLRFRALGVFGDNDLGALWLPELIDNRAIAGIHSPFGYARRLGQRLLKATGDGPAFFAMHATAAHFPGDPSFPFYRAQLDGRFPLEKRLRMNFAPVVSREAVAGAQTGKQSSEAQSRQAAEGLYDELIAQADAQWGQWARMLKEAGRYDNAWVIVFSDHGESFHEDRPELAGVTPVHGARLGEIENHIVLAVKPPKGWARNSDLPLPRHVEALTRLVDIGPTILEVMNAPALPQVAGQSLVPLMEGRGEPRRLLYAETGFTHISPDIFEATHLAGAPRSFDAYRVLPTGVVELKADAHAAVLREKDLGAFDGEHWLVQAPMRDGGMDERCTGNCDELRGFLGEVTGGGHANSVEPFGVGGQR